MYPDEQSIIVLLSIGLCHSLKLLDKQCKARRFDFDCDVIIEYDAKILKHQRKHFVTYCNSFEREIDVKYCVRNGLSKVYFQLFIDISRFNCSSCIRDTLFIRLSRGRQHCYHPHVRETSRIITLHVTSPWPMKLTVLFWRDNKVS
jgi:hypothetical protein